MSTIVLMMGANTINANAESFNTGFILDEMPNRERSVHVDGLVRGLAFAHYFDHDNDNEGFKCRLKYALTGNNADWVDMLDFAENHPEQPLGGVLYVYLNKKCGG